MNTTRNWIASAVVAFITVTVHAHPGGLDTQGCHRNRQTGDYHCHRSSSGGTTESPDKRNPDTSRKPTGTDRRITGMASVIDGDTIEIHGKRIRLFGIDAPESRQTCQRNGKPEPCGRKAAHALANLIDRKTVTCDPKAQDRYGRIVAICYRNKLDINAWLVENGHALAYRKYSQRYLPNEKIAARNQSGIWSTRFQPPWDWRRRPKN